MQIEQQGVGCVSKPGRHLDSLPQMARHWLLSPLAALGGGLVSAREGVMLHGDAHAGEAEAMSVGVGCSHTC
jgi:hypothetical protein